jgi:porin
MSMPAILVKLKFYRQIFTVLLLLIVPFLEIKAQEENRLSSAFEFETNIIGDFVVNFHGGIKTGTTYIGLESFSLLFDTEKAGLWKGGNLFIHALNTHGLGPSETLTGDLQVFSNIEAGNYTGLYEYYYSQEIGNFSAIIGQHDMNSEFAGTKYGGTFINSSFGIVPSISLNVPVSIYPVAAPCLLFKYNSHNFTYKIAVYDGDPGNFETNRYDLQWSISPGQGFLTIGEVQYNRFKKENLIGMYKMGSYYHSGTFINYADTLLTKKGNYGLYFIADQALFASSLNAGRGLCFFIQTGIAPSAFNRFDYYVGGGLRYHGILPKRYYDELGLAFAHISQGKYYVDLYEEALRYETALEMTYKFQFGEHYSIQPSMQYIITPGAVSGVENALVGLIRLNVVL